MTAKHIERRNPIPPAGRVLIILIVRPYDHFELLDKVSGLPRTRFEVQGK